MKVKQAKEYFELGIITGLDAVRDPMGKGWLLVVVGKEGRSWTLQTAKGESKTFSSLDTLVGEIEAITGRVSSLHVGV